MTGGGDNGNGGQSRSSARRCLDEMSRNISALLTRHDALELRLDRSHNELHDEAKACRMELANIHTRISDVRKDLSQLHVDLASAISYSKGTKAAHKGFFGPVVATLAAAISGFLVWMGIKIAGGGGGQ